MQQYQIVSKQVTQVDNDSKMRAVTKSQELKFIQCDLNHANTDKCNIN